MKSKLTVAVLLISLVLIVNPLSLLQRAVTHAFSQSTASASPGLCTAFCLDNGDHCVFGANFDNSFENGLLLVNKRHVLKTTWDPSTSGEYARWVSRYASVTFNLIGYQMVWSGMNEAGLMISTMSVVETRSPIPDERTPFQSPYWMQYQLDNHSTVDQVIASNVEIRISDPAVDHYLVCDRTGECASIEFLEGKLVSHTGETLPVKALTNSTYQQSILGLEEDRLEGSPLHENSLWRFAMVDYRLSTFEPSDTEAAVNYAFETLEAVTFDNTVWSLVYDPVALRVYFHTNHNPEIRYLDFSGLDFSCQSQVMMLDVHADVSGDIRDDLVDYSHDVSYRHSKTFFTEYEGVSMSPILVDTLLWGVESFTCQESGSALQGGLTRYQPLIPPTILWAGLMILHRGWPIWGLLTALSLAYLIWHMARDRPTSMSKHILWVLVTILLGPIGLLAYLAAHRRRHQAGKAS